MAKAAGAAILYCVYDDGETQMTHARHDRAPIFCRRHLRLQRLKKLLTLWAVIGAVGIPAAQAQSIDYGSFEHLFGESVTTSATGLPERVTNVPVNMTIITADEISRSGARDIPGVLRHVAGVDIMQWSNDDSDISVRGYDQAFAARTLVLTTGDRSMQTITV